jgi:UDP-N-acetylmuramoyl-tripeptide--D-alanyl-D-alanine ligase
LSERFWTDLRVREALGLADGAAEPSFRSVSTDTRTLGEGDLFVALVGERFDGHDFLETAARAGAAGAIVSDPAAEALPGLTLYHVDDTLAALGKLAAYRRSRLGARFIGVVGSNGKTTTKELIRAVLATRFRTHATQGNLNNQIGVPLTLLQLPEDTEVAVVEMGTDRPGEIAALTAIVRPDLVVVTSIGEEHLELLGDLDGVLREELSVLDGLAENGRAFVAAEPETLPRRAREIAGRGRVRTAGTREGADIRPDGGDRGIRTLEDGSTLWRWRGVEVRLPIPGRFNVRNALLALGVGLELGVPAQEAARNLAGVSLPKLRGQWVRYGDLKVLADCYNANPPSVIAAIDLLSSLPVRGRRVAVLGTMRELGSASEQLHASLADRIAKMLGDGLDLVVATGDFAPAFERHRPRLGDQLVIQMDPIAAFERVAPGLRPADTILLKASRGDELERWLPLLESRFGGGE